MTEKTKAQLTTPRIELPLLPNLTTFCMSLFRRFADNEGLTIDIDRNKDNSIIFSFNEIETGKEVKVKFKICEECIEEV